MLVDRFVRAFHGWHRFRVPRGGEEDIHGDSKCVSFKASDRILGNMWRHRGGTVSQVNIVENVSRFES